MAAKHHPAGARPAVELLAYQREWVADPARFKLGLWARQSGKSFAASLEAVLDCFERKTKWVFLSAGERQSKELMSTAAIHARAINAAVEMMDSNFHAADGADYKQLEIVFANGSRIVGLPANPDTARGHSAHVLLDEFAFHKDSRAIWRSLFPTTTRGYKLRIVSTPQGKQNKFYELWSGGGAGSAGGTRSGSDSWTRHQVSIHEAVAQGLELRDQEGKPCTPADLEAALADPDGWQQEYLCQFLDEATAFLTYELIGECEGEAERDKSVPPTGPIYIGVDVGRKKDLTVIWIVEQVGDVFWTWRIEELSRMPFAQQRDVLWGFIADLAPRRVCMDATGLGMQLAEETLTRFGSLVEPVTFSLATKEDLATTMRRTFEDKRVRIPVDRALREDLHSVKRLVTSAGNIRFDAERTADGHADRFWSLALALHGATKPGSGFIGVLPQGYRFAEMSKRGWHHEPKT